MKLTNEAKIGILVVGVLGILAVLTWKAGDFEFSPKGYEINLTFRNINGVSLNAPVTLNGLEIGRVKEIHILEDQKNLVQLVLWVNDGVHIHEGVRAQVKNMGFLGEKYVGLTSSPEPGNALPPGGLIAGSEPTSFEELLQQGKTIAQNLKEISSQINERIRVNSDHIDSIFSDLDKTMGNMVLITDNIQERLEVNKLVVDETVGHINAASKNLEEMTYDLKINPWKLMYKSKDEDQK